MESKKLKRALTLLKNLDISKEKTAMIEQEIANIFTDHEQLVEQLKQNEKDLLKSQAIAHLGTWRLDIKTNEVVWTEELYKMYGFNPKLPVPNYTEHMKLFKPKSWEKLSVALELTRTQGVPYELELETVTKDGSNGWMWVRGEAEKDKGGKIIAIWGAAQDITERKRILEQLEQKEKNLLEAQKIAKIGSWRLDAKTNHVEWTEELYKMYELDPTLPTPDLMEQKKMFAPESWERLSNSIDLAISKGIPYELEVQTLKNDDTIGWMWTRAEIEKNTNGEIIAIHGVAQDITERKLVLEQLKRKEKQLLDSQSISRVGSFRLNLITNEIEWTDEVYKMFRVDPTLPAIPYEEQMKTYTKDSWEKLSSAVDLTAKKGIGYTLELEIVRQDGSNGWIWIKGEAEKDKHGKIVAILGVAQDITERKEQEESLKQSEERFRVLHNASFGGIAIHNEGLILECNQGLSDVTGYSINELIGMNGLELIASEDRDYVLKNIRNGIEKPYEVVGVRKNKERYHLRLEARNIPYKNEQVRVVEFRDISEQKRQEKELYKATYFDQLTGLYNRSQLINTLNEIDMEKSPKIGLIIFDIDNLKLLNSHFDSSVGNEALIVAAKTLEQHIRDDDMLFRFGGDEFAILVKDTDEKSLRALARKVVLDFSGKTISGVSMTLSFGIAMLSSNNQDIGKIMIDAEEDVYRYKSVHMNSSHFSVLKMILGFLTEKFHYEKRHSEFVGVMSAKLGEHLLLSKDEVDELSVAGMFHDIGKITIPDEILNKPGKLTDEEYEIIKQHSVIGHDIIKSAIPYSKLHKVILHHHERYDGNGYPEGLKGNDIPFLSRILCVVDAYEAMTSNRVYSKKMSKGEAIEELKRFKGIQFDPIVTEAFIEILL